jgi:hypothetical protein
MLRGGFHDHVRRDGHVRSKTVVIAKLVQLRPSAADAEDVASKSVSRSDMPNSPQRAMKRMQQDEHAIRGSVACIDESTRPAPDRGYFQ